MKLRIKSLIWNIKKNKQTENNQSEQQEEKIIKMNKNKNEDSIISPWDKFKHINILIIGVPEEEEKQGTGNLFEKIWNKTY